MSVFGVYSKLKIKIFYMNSSYFPGTMNDISWQWEQSSVFCPQLMESTEGCLSSPVFDIINYISTRSFGWFNISSSRCEICYFIVFMIVSNELDSGQDINNKRKISFRISELYLVCPFCRPQRLTKTNRLISINRQNQCQCLLQLSRQSGLTLFS